MEKFCVNLNVGTGLMSMGAIRTASSMLLIHGSMVI